MKKHKEITLQIARILLGGECDRRAANGIRALRGEFMDRIEDSTLFEHLYEQFLDNDAVCEDKEERKVAKALHDFTENNLEEMVSRLASLVEWVFDTKDSKMAKCPTLRDVMEKAPYWFREQFADSIREKFPELAEEIEDNNDEELPVERDEENTFTGKPAPAQVIVGPAVKAGFDLSDYISPTEAAIPHVDIYLDQLRELIETRLNVSVNFYQLGSGRKKTPVGKATALPLPIFQIVVGRVREMPLALRNAEQLFRSMMECGVQLFAK